MKLSLSTGLLSKLGGNTPHISDSFSLGLDSFRGFDDCGVGPFYETHRYKIGKDIFTKKEAVMHEMARDYAGAKKYWKGTVEYVFPIGLPEELQFRGFVFSDFGTLWDPPYKKKNKYVMTYKVDSDLGKAKIVDLGERVVLKGFGAKSLEEIKNEEFMSCAYDSNVFRHKILDSKKTRASVGFGISFVTPFGPMKFTYAIPIRKEKYDEQYRFMIGFSTSF